MPRHLSRHHGYATFTDPAELEDDPQRPGSSNHAFHSDLVVICTAPFICFAFVPKTNPKLYNVTLTITSPQNLLGMFKAFRA
jgi:hypothetical protein